MSRDPTHEAIWKDKNKKTRSKNHAACVVKGKRVIEVENKATCNGQCTP